MNRCYQTQLLVRGYTPVVVGRTYLERGEPVVVLVRSDWKAGGPRNVLIRRADGTRVVRPFRGLRKVSS